MNLHPTQRHLPIPGTYNIRDLGGYPTSDGRMTRWRTFLRADALHRLSPEGQQVLLDLGLDTVIDLRFAKELEESPNVFATSNFSTPSNGAANDKNSVNYVNISLMDGLSLAASSGQTLLVQPLDTLEAIYQAMLTHCQPALRAVFDVMSASDGEALLFHCTAGKDRTGLIAAMLLGLAGVAPETIAEDYALTDQYLDELKQELRAKAAASGQNLEHYERMLESKPEAMRNTLAFIEQQYGGVVAYLQQIGLTDAQIDTLQNMLAE